MILPRPGGGGGESGGRGGGESRGRGGGGAVTGALIRTGSLTRRKGSFVRSFTETQKLHEITTQTCSDVPSRPPPHPQEGAIFRTVAHVQKHT